MLWVILVKERYECYADICKGKGDRGKAEKEMDCIEKAEQIQS